MQGEPEAGECLQHNTSLTPELGIGGILLVDDSRQNAERLAERQEFVEGSRAVQVVPPSVLLETPALLPE